MRRIFDGELRGVFGRGLDVRFVFGVCNKLEAVRQGDVAEIVPAQDVTIGGCPDGVLTVIYTGEGDLVEQGRVLLFGVGVIG